MLFRSDGEAKDALELDAGTFARVMDVNVRGLLLASRAATRRMPDGGAIVLLASVNAFQTEARFADYNASKGAAVLLTRTLAIDWAARGIRVNAVCPGYVRTPMTEAYLADPATLAGILSHVPLGRVSSPDEIAATIGSEKIAPSGPPTIPPAVPARNTVDAGSRRALSRRRGASHVAQKSQAPTMTAMPTRAFGPAASTAMRSGGSRAGPWPSVGIAITRPPNVPASTPSAPASEAPTYATAP